MLKPLQVRFLWMPVTGYALMLLGGMTACSTPAPDQPNEAELELRVLSGRPGMVSGDDVLVEVSGPGDGILQDVSVTLDERDVTAAFLPGRTPGSLVGIVDELALGTNTLVARAAGFADARLQLQNHPSTGPIFSGPHQTPFVCETEAAGLGPALDEHCSADTVVSYIYKSTDVPSPSTGVGLPEPGALPQGFKVFDPSKPPPADVATITTNKGHVVDYIVRRETGTINRAIYEITFLHAPNQPLPDPWTATPGWNGRLVYSFGGGCSAGYRQGGAGLGLFGADGSLSQGYAIAASSLNVFGNNCDDVISAETMMMVKEHFIKRFGVPVHTIGIGGSGGAIQQHLIAQNYPGLLDGIIPTIGYPDITSVIPGVVDCSLLAQAFDTSTQSWSDDQKTAVSGFATFRTCTDSWVPAPFAPEWVKPASCAPSIPEVLVYDPITNPGGARCDLYDNEVHVYGRDPDTGFARRPLDNVGVQYGLVAFNAGTITAEQFLELNEQIGGYDIDGNIVADRSVADLQALRLAYQTGRVNTGGGGLGAIPIIDLRVYLDKAADIHDRFRTFATRARLMAANGRADNQVILTLPSLEGIGGLLAPTSPYRERSNESLGLMDQWLGNIAKDGSVDDPAGKVARNKPDGLHDACWTPEGEKLVDSQANDAPGRCAELFPNNGDPRIAAGGPIANDILKCAVKPVDPADYAQGLTDVQLERLNVIFPNGVCDYDSPGVEQQQVEGTWRTYSS